ncbi:hypothetical protein Purlil1_12863 [Purpureocillium lilacinum]|uniref:Uncharacterized protein n=1 Tax=Purpureocillium lilacinum TaxID=33203 RepID=A0ABR0BFM4_PURLI|nr:hypothetical protein Purlil1_12863 [Purpureocillium lilacinum]
MSPKVDEPEAGSLIATIRSHRRTRLYVKPLWWIGMHLRVLGCEYVERGPPLQEWTQRPELKITADGCAVIIVPRETDEVTSDLGDALSGARSATARTSVLGDFLAASFTPPRDTPLALYYNGTPINIATHGAFVFDSAIPPLTFIDLQGLRSIRRHYLRRKWVQTPSSPQHIPTPVTEKNGPILGIINKRLRQLQPVIELEDPYIVAILIALAQKQCHEGHEAGLTTHPGNYDTQGPFKVHLLALSASQTLCVYKAHFPHSFLEKFNNPSKFSPSGPVSISYHQLPHLDPKGLRDELYRSLHN